MSRFGDNFDHVERLCYFFLLRYERGGGIFDYVENGSLRSLLFLVK